MEEFFEDDKNRDKDDFFDFMEGGEVAPADDKAEDKDDFFDFMEGGEVAGEVAGADVKDEDFFDFDGASTKTQNEDDDFEDDDLDNDFQDDYQPPDTPSAIVETFSASAFLSHFSLHHGSYKPSTYAAAFQHYQSDIFHPTQAADENAMKYIRLTCEALHSSLLDTTNWAALRNPTPYEGIPPPPPYRVEEVAAIIAGCAAIRYADASLLATVDHRIRFLLHGCETQIAPVAAICYALVGLGHQISRDSRDSVVNHVRNKVIISESKEDVANLCLSLAAQGDERLLSHVEPEACLWCLDEDKAHDEVLKVYAVSCCRVGQYSEAFVDALLSREADVMDVPEFRDLLVKANVQLPGDWF